MAKLIKQLSDIDFSLDQVPLMPLPDTALMVDPKYFDVVYTINPHMEGNIGKIDRSAAYSQWESIKSIYESIGIKVPVVDGVNNLPDMVFCANQSLPYLTENGEKKVLMSRMRYEQRMDEVPYIQEWYASQGFDIQLLDHQDTFYFEGMGDAIWHLGKRLLWGGFGYRTNADVYEQIAAYFDVPVILLELKHDDLYHLDTCFSVLNEDTVLIYSKAFTEEGLKMIHKLFKNVIDTDEHETLKLLACNAVCPDGKHVIIQKGCNKAVADMKAFGFEVHEVETEEYLKSGGSVFCMKMLLWNLA